MATAAAMIFFFIWASPPFRYLAQFHRGDHDPSFFHLFCEFQKVPFLSIVMGGEVRARPCEHHTELLRKISGLCNNANQLAHVANGCGMAGEESIREMLRMTKETWRLVKEEW